MKTIAVIGVAAASMGAATAFTGTTQMIFGGNKKAAGAQKQVASKVGAAKQVLGGKINKVAPAVKNVAAKAKSAAPTPFKSTFAQKQAASAKSVASSAKSAATPAIRKAAPAVKQAASKATSAFNQAKQNVATTSGSSDALAFGTDVEAGFWDPIQLAADKPAETLEWYRAAELKHGRVAMLAVLGTWIQAAGIHLPDSTFDAPPRSFDALAKVASERPGAIGQILLAIAAVEVLTIQLNTGAFPGDLGFDPANQIPVYERQGKFDELRLKELKNGRLAMVGIIGMWVQEYLTGQGVFEQLLTGHLSPVNDGQGYF